MKENTGVRRIRLIYTFMDCFEDTSLKIRKILRLFVCSIFLPRKSPFCRALNSNISNFVHLIFSIQVNQIKKNNFCSGIFQTGFSKCLSISYTDKVCQICLEFLKKNNEIRKGLGKAQIFCQETSFSLIFDFCFLLIFPTESSKSFWI